MWRAYQASGYSRLIYTNTAAVFPDVMDRLLGALGGGLGVHAVLLQANTETVTSRLAQREIGSALESHVKRSQRAALELDAAAPAWVRRVDTNRRSVAEVARSVQNMVDWPLSAEDL